MRLAIATAVVIAACVTPAAAQRVDTRRYLVGGPGTGQVSCRFTANKYFKLEHAPNGTHSIAEWMAWAAGTEASQGLMLEVVLARRAGTDDAGVAAAGFEIPVARRAFSRPVVSTRILIDGLDSGIPTRLERRLRTLRVFPLEGRAQVFGQRLMDAKTATLELLDGHRALVRSYTWDVDRFDDDVERVQLVHWNCSSPDR